MKNVSGKSEDDMFEKSMLTGGDIFSLTVARDISNIDEFLVFCYRRFKEDTYRERFAWVDNIKYVTYAVSIHKAQGLEYDSVKVIIPSNNAEKITHGIFYTAITRAKTNLKIYWSSETMHDVVKGFATDESKRKSLEIVKTKLGKN